MTQDEINDYFKEMGIEDAIIFETPSYCSAFIGISHDGRAVYDFEEMIRYLMDGNGMSYEEAVEFIDYNTIRAIPYFGAKAPIVLYPIQE